MLFIPHPNMGLDVRNPVLGACEQQMRRAACASTQSDQNLCHSYLESIISKHATQLISTINRPVYCRNNCNNDILVQLPKVLEKLY